MKPKIPPILTTYEAAKLIDRSGARVWQLAQKGVLEGYRTPTGRWLILEESVHRYLVARGSR